MNFAERLGKHYDDMLKLRESLGYSIDNNQNVAREFIAFCGDRYPNNVSITKEMVEYWLQSKDFKTNATHNIAVTKIRGFTRYLASVGIAAFIPNQDYSVRHIHYTPYVFTDEELVRLFEAVDNLPPYHSSPKREHIVPVLFRMMYCCGMRPSEPPSLLAEDVNLNNGEVYIRQSKGCKDRRILMSSELTALCREYAIRIMPQNYFFEQYSGKRISSKWVTRQFHCCWRSSGMLKRGNPRPYDLRHNFAARTIMRWVNEGRDIYALAPYLSAYMGHMKFSSTFYYIHLVPERLMKSPGIDWTKFAGIYPEVRDE